MSPAELKTAWTAKWQKMLDDHDHRMAHPEAYRVLCHWETRDMLAEGVIDQAEKMEMDELANAAYWHAVEELVTGDVGYLYGGHYRVMRSDGSCVGQIIANTYYSAEGPGADGFDGKVFFDGAGARLEFRHGGKPWPLDGLVLNSARGEAYDLVQFAQNINGAVYPSIGDPDCYRALVDRAQVALENHDFDTYRKARLLILSAHFVKCGACLDNFKLREGCHACIGCGFLPRYSGQPSSSA
ncbi:hypothetical protein [Pseudomonas sp.]|uniref:hypothetical protein n=1 Tax=Pseudomonas sp. TaxID=306 RepID=UPI002612F001|nr:hypothetical protein [Pseudomonas sp.]